MSIMNCPSCGKGLRLPDQTAGGQLQCPHCQNTFTSPVPSDEAAPIPSAQITSSPPPLRGSRADEGETASRPPRGRRRFRDDDEDDYDDDLDIRRGWDRDLAPHRGATILTLGILSIVICGPILGPIAWVMGSNDLKEMRAGRMDPSGEGVTRAGQILGMVATILAIVLICIYALIFSVAVVAQH